MRLTKRTTPVLRHAMLPMLSSCALVLGMGGTAMAGPHGNGEIRMATAQGKGAIVASRVRGLNGNGGSQAP